MDHEDYLMGSNPSKKSLSLAGKQEWQVWIFNLDDKELIKSPS
jgi:hypothetical protein